MNHFKLLHCPTKGETQLSDKPPYNLKKKAMNEHMPKKKNKTETPKKKRGMYKQGF